uniref:Uncharacterized protein n=1 Tax=Arundo donax TaxID=35708 RepID=A0A0A9E2G9_ARUDO
MSTVQIMILISFDTIKFQFAVRYVVCSTSAIEHRKLYNIMNPNWFSYWCKFKYGMRLHMLFRSSLASLINQTKRWLW